MVDEELSSRSFGLNGEALASLSDISVVEVRTKARGRPNSYCKIIKAPPLSFFNDVHYLDYPWLVHLNSSDNRTGI